MPHLGRWLTRDPLGEAGGVNLYAYVGNNPVNWVDPWGFQYAADINVWDKIVAAALAAKELLPAMPAITVSMPAVAATGLFGGILLYPSDIMPEPPIPLPVIPINNNVYSKADEGSCPFPDATPGRTTQGRTKQYEKSGDYGTANDDFDDLGPTDVKDISNGGRVGILPDGRTIIVRPISKDGRPTLEIQDGKVKIKIRYGK